MTYFKFIVWSFLALCLSASYALAQTPVQKHGDLRISGKHIVDKKGAVTSLAGPSFFWSNTGWGQDRFYTRGAVETFARDWKAGIVRVAVGAQEAKAFFTHMAKRYGHTPNIIYEIYNEPLDTTDWNRTVKPYAEELIRTIRAIDPDNLIIVGTQTWAQDVDKAADNPIRGQKNILYALHFYAATHKGELRERAQYAINKGLPIIISEWGTVTYSGDGYLDIDESIEWMKFAKRNKLSHLAWSVSDKDESASMLKPGASANGRWREEDLTLSGRLVQNIMQNW